MYACMCACLFVLSNLSTSCARVCMEGLEVGLVSAFSWLALVSGVGGYVLEGVEIGVFVLYIFSIFTGVGVYAGICV